VSTPYLFDNAVLDRHAKLANGLPVEGELVFADRLWLLTTVPAVDEDADEVLLDTFLDRKRYYGRDQRGGVGLGVLLIVVLVGGGAWGWTHSSSAPNGATLLGILLLAIAIAVPTVFIRWWRNLDRACAAYTAEVEGRVQQDTTGDHIWDA
jgi:hypothetical protein